MKFPFEIAFEAIGTRWHIHAGTSKASRRSSSSDCSIHTLQDRWIETMRSAHELIERFDSLYSRYKPTSFVSKLSSRTGIIAVEEDFTTLLIHYLPLYHLSRGKINPLIGTLLQIKSSDSPGICGKKNLPKVPPLTDTIEVLDPRHIRIREPVLFDFGAVGKGYLVDLVFTHLQNAGFARCIVDAGGDMRVNSPEEPVPIGLEHPQETSKAIGIARLKHGAIAGSAGNRRVLGDQHHIIDPDTGGSPRNVVASWALASTAATADALSTALFFVEPERLRRQYAFDYVLMLADGSVRVSDSFRGELFRK